MEQLSAFTNLPYANIIGWLAFGLLIGIVASFLDPASAKGGAMATILLGIVGAFIGGIAASFFFDIAITGFNMQSFLIAIAGALLFIMLQRLLFRENNHIKTRTTNFK